MNKYTDQEILEARAKLWRMGNIEWKFDITQRQLYEFAKTVTGKILVINCSRRLGKSYLLTAMAIQQCLSKPKSIVKFLQPEKGMVTTNIQPLMEEILQDCPSDVRPVFKTQNKIYYFPHNGSQIQLAGTDGGNAENLRGGNSDLCIIDEAAFVKAKLGYIIRSILMPTTLLTRGKIVLSSTSPTDPDNEFAKYMEKAEKDGTLMKKTIYDALEDQKGLINPRITPEYVQEQINEYPGGIANDEFRREYLCEIIRDGDNSVLPEFNAEIMTETVIEWPRPAFCDKYVSMDIGFKDLTVALFAYYDFENAVVVIEDELVMNGYKMTTDKLAEGLRKKEVDLWTNKMSNELERPYKRISDNNYIVLNDLQQLHGLTFIPTNKDDKDAAVNNTRMMITNHQIIIHPRCKTLIHHMKHASWDKNRKKFTRSVDGAHYDAVDSLLYLIRNIDKNKNPYPKGYRFKKYADRGEYFINPYHKETTGHEQFKNLFKPRKTSKT